MICLEHSRRPPRMVSLSACVNIWIGEINTHRSVCECVCVVAGRSIAVGAVRRMSHRNVLFEEKESVCGPCAALVCVCVRILTLGGSASVYALIWVTKWWSKKKLVFPALNVYGITDFDVSVRIYLRLSSFSCPQRNIRQSLKTGTFKKQFRDPVLIFHFVLLVRFNLLCFPSRMDFVNLRISLGS